MQCQLILRWYPCIRCTWWPCAWYYWHIVPPKTITAFTYGNTSSLLIVLIMEQLWWDENCTQAKDESNWMPQSINCGNVLQKDNGQYCHRLHHCLLLYLIFPQAVFAPTLISKNQYCDNANWESLCGDFVFMSFHYVYGLLPLVSWSWLFKQKGKGNWWNINSVCFIASIQGISGASPHRTRNLGNTWTTCIKNF